jgi:putative endonuclease
VRANIDAGQQAHERHVQTAATAIRGGGMAVLDTNWDGPEGRLDIVAADTRCAVAVLVRQSERPLSRAEVRRQRGLVAAWLTAHGVRFDQIRVDVAIVTGSAAEPVVNHMVGVLS